MKFPIVSFVRGSLLMVALALPLVGCQKRYGSEFESADKDGYVIHTVKYPGETLFSISMWYTGVGANWTAIQAANPGLQPNRMKIGDVVRIPRRFAIKGDPLPASAASTGVARKSSSGSSKVSEKSSDTSRGNSKAVVTEKSDTSAMEEMTDRNAEKALVIPSSSSLTSSAMSSTSSATASKLETFDEFDEVMQKGSASSADASSAVSSAAAMKGGTVKDNAAQVMPGTNMPNGVPTVTAADKVGAAVSSAAAAPAEVERRSKSRDELLQELLKDY